MIETLLGDVRHALRGLRREPAFAAVMVLTLGIGLGVNTAVFSLLDQLFVATPPGVTDASRVRRAYLTTPGRDGTTDVRDRFNYPELADLRAGAPAGVQVAAYSTDSIA